MTQEYREGLIHAVCRRLRSLGLPFSLWKLQRLAAHMAEQTSIRVRLECVRAHLRAEGIVLSSPHNTITSPDIEYALKKTIEETLDNLGAEAMWIPEDQHMMIQTPAQPKSATASERSTTTPARRWS